MFLVGDVGGTKSILALYKSSNESSSCVKKTLYASSQYSTFIGLLTEFLLDVTEPIAAVCIGVAGPVVNGDCVATNLPWFLRCKEIAQVVKASNVWLLNDLEATAWGILGLPTDDFVDLNPNAKPAQSGNVAVIAAGTGLGEAMMIWDGNKHHIIATEGGHADFAPVDQQQIGLLGFLMQKYDGHVSYERLLSGEGLVNIYQYLKHIGYAPVSPSIEGRMQQQDPAAVIGKAGTEGGDKLCAEALSLFCKIYGAEAGNLALKCLPYKGVYLAGGIAGKILPALTNNFAFLEGFLNKGRSKAVLERIPIKACVNQDVGLLGALNFIEAKGSKTNLLPG